MNRRERRVSAKGRIARDQLLQRPNGLARQLHRLADEQFRQGNFTEAERRYRQTLLADPGHVRSLYQLGVMALRNGRVDVAIATFNKVIALDGRHPEAHNNLGLALQKHNRFEAAVVSHLRALELWPGFAEAHNNVGVALQQINRHVDAIAHFEKALKPGPNPYFQHNLANSLRILGRYDDAIACLEAALSGAPRSSDTHRDMGSLLLILGRIEEARSELRKAIELSPRKPSAYRLLAEASPLTSDDPFFTRMERLSAEMERLEVSDQIELHFAMGKALADVGECERSFQHYLAGNALKRSQIGYDEASVLGSLEFVRTGVTSVFLAKHRGAGEPSPVPTFIVGMPRSGTTLVEQILAAHSEVFAAGERNDLPAAIKARFQADSGPSCILKHLDEHRPEQWRELGAAYLAAIQATAPEARRITDKMPTNFQFVGLIHVALPSARIIHVRRNPIDTCLSCFSHLFDGEVSFTYDLGELGRYWKAYDRLMAHWHDILPADVMLDVEYEDLVRDFEPQARRIVAHCGLEWDPGCLTFHKTERPVATASWVQVRQPIYSHSVGRWRPNEAVLQPLLDALRE